MFVPEPTGPFAEELKGYLGRDDQTSYERALQEAWKDLKGTRALTALQIFCRTFEEVALEELASPNTTPDRRQLIAGNISAIRSIWATVDHCVNGTEEPAPPPADNVSDAALAIPYEEPTY